MHALRPRMSSPETNAICNPSVYAHWALPVDCCFRENLVSACLWLAGKSGRQRATFPNQGSGQLFQEGANGQLSQTKLTGNLFRLGAFGQLLLEGANERMGQFFGRPTGKLSGSYRPSVRAADGVDGHSQPVATGRCLNHSSREISMQPLLKRRDRQRELHFFSGGHFGNQLMSLEALVPHRLSEACFTRDAVCHSQGRSCAWPFFRDHCWRQTQARPP